MALEAERGDHRKSDGSAAHHEKAGIAVRIGGVDGMKADRERFGHCGLVLGDVIRNDVQELFGGDQTFGEAAGEIVGEADGLDASGAARQRHRDDARSDRQLAERIGTITNDFATEFMAENHVAFGIHRVGKSGAQREYAPALGVNEGVQVRTEIPQARVRSKT